MIFACDKCQDRYRISDEKLLRAVRKEIVLRCKNCSYTIRLQLPIPEDCNGWYLVYEDESFGPFETLAVRKFYREGGMSESQKIRQRDAVEIVSIDTVAAFADLFRSPRRL